MRQAENILLSPWRDEARAEVKRKSIHFLIAFSPAIAALSYRFIIYMLITGVTAYIVMELLRLNDINVPLVSKLTVMASRHRDRGHFVYGPVTLGIGALLALLLFPLPAASIAIYALAFGDGFASLSGKLFGCNYPVILSGKSIEGSAACFVAVYISAFLASRDASLSFAAAITAAAAESLPLKDFDNIVIPLAVGVLVTLW